MRGLPQDFNLRTQGGEFGVRGGGIKRGGRGIGLSGERGLLHASAGQGEGQPREEAAKPPEEEEGQHEPKQDHEELFPPRFTRPGDGGRRRQRRGGPWEGLALADDAIPFV